MISIRRPDSIPEPLLYDKEIKSSIQKLERHFKSGSAVSSQTRYDFESVKFLLFKKLYPTLKVVFNSKCCYCERKIAKPGFQHIEHFRPTHSAEGWGKEGFAPLHYWWLSFEWTNIYLACETCISRKGTLFPVEGSRAPLEAGPAMIKKEQALLLDPCSLPDISWKFMYTSQGEIVHSKANNGHFTVDLLELNRSELVKARGSVIPALTNRVHLWMKFFEGRRQLTNSPKNEFLSATYYFLDVLRGQSAEEFLGIKYFFFYKEVAASKSAAMNGFVKTGIIPAHLSFADEPLNALYQHIQQTRNRVSANKKRKLPATESEKKETKRSPAKKKAGKPAKASAPVILSKEYRIRSVEIKNFKSLDTIKLNVPVDKSYTPWLMMLGENGVGKSSALQAIALALTSASYQKSVLQKTAASYLRHKTTAGSVIIHFDNEKKPLHIRFNGKTCRVVSKPQDFLFPPTTFLAYGSTRLFPGQNLQPETDGAEEKDRPAGRVQNLFYPGCSLYSSEEWLKEIYTKNRQDFDFAALAIKSLVDLDAAFDLYDKTGTAARNESLQKGLRLVYHKGRICVQRGNHRYLLEQLSDGYQSIIALSVDIMRALFRLNTDMINASAIVLVDEIGTHLHPRWKMRVVSSLRKAFPKVQFIVTTHDPLCLKGMAENEVVVLRSDDNNRTYLVKELPDPGKLRADQLLTSEYFGLSSTIDPETEKAFTRYYYLRSLSKAELKKTKREEEMQELERLLRANEKDSKHLGDSLREEIVYHVIDELLAKNFRQRKPLAKQELKSAAVKRVQDLWKKLDQQTVK